MRIRQSKTDSMSNKQIGINMVAQIISFSSNLLISFVLTPFLINNLGKETYSFYPIVNTFIMYMSIVTGALNTMASRFVTISIVKGEMAEADKYFSSVTVSNLILSAVLFIPMVFIVVYLDRILNIPVNAVAAIRSLFALAFSSMLVNVMSSMFGIATFAKNRIDLRSIRELIVSCVRLGLFVLLYSVFPASIVFVGLVALIVALLNLAFQLFYTKQLLPEIRIRRSCVSLPYVKEIFRASVWNMIFTLGNLLLVQMTIVLSNVFYGANTSGLLSIVQTVPQFISSVISMLVGVFYPVLTYKVANHDVDGIQSEVLRTEKFIGSFSFAVIVVFSALAEEFFSLWTPNEHAALLSKLSFVTILPHILIGCLWSLTNLNIAMNKVKIPALYTLGAGFLNIALSFLAAKIFRRSYVCLPIICTALQIVWIGVLIPRYSCSQIGIKTQVLYRPFIRLLAVGVVLFVGIFWLKGCFQLSNWFCFVLFAAPCGAVSLLVFAVTAFVPSECKSIWKTILHKIHPAK